MLNNTRSKHYRKLLQGFLIIVLFDLFLLEILVRIIVSLKPVSLSYSVDLDWKSQIVGESLINRQSPYILAMGSSITNQNLNPELLQYELQKVNPELAVFNLAHSGGTVESNLYLLKKVLATSSKPLLIIYDYPVPWQFNGGYLSKPDSTLNHFYNYYTGRCLPSIKRDFSTRLECGVKKYSYLYRHWHDLPVILSKFPKLIFKPETNILFTDSGNISRNGWIPRYIHLSQNAFDSYYSPRGINFNQREKGIKYLFSDFSFDSSHFEKLVKFSQAQQIPILIVWYPEHPLSLDYFKKYQVKRSLFNEYLTELEKKDQVDSLNLSDSLNSQRYYSDPDHLNTLGANKFTLTIAQYLIQSVL